jgi:hypothetical protein
LVVLPIDDVFNRTRDIWSSLSGDVSVHVFVDNVFDQGDVRNVDNAGEGDNWQQWGEYL